MTNDEHAASPSINRSASLEGAIPGIECQSGDRRGGESRSRRMWCSAVRSKSVRRAWQEESPAGRGMASLRGKSNLRLFGAETLFEILHDQDRYQRR